jgi:hypothetical protein
LPNYRRKRASSRGLSKQKNPDHLIGNVDDILIVFLRAPLRGDHEWAK